MTAPRDILRAGRFFSGIELSIGADPGQITAKMSISDEWQ